MENYKRLLIGSEPRLLRKHNGYYYKVGDMLTITILGNFCGLRDLQDIHDWASNVVVREFLRRHFRICDLPCYSWFTRMLR
ncbi:MAG: hypothetical protein LBD85_05185, partial [Oscillospiraceae bacterium]|nr:hypothetical protein [Oscillospiraceae bacterium]